MQLLEGENVIGRDPDAALWIDHASVSRRHARIVIGGGKATLEDLESKNGTFLNGKSIAKRTRCSRRRRAPSRAGDDDPARAVAGHHEDRKANLAFSGAQKETLKAARKARGA